MELSITNLRIASSYAPKDEVKEDLKKSDAATNFLADVPEQNARTDSLKVQLTRCCLNFHNAMINISLAVPDGDADRNTIMGFINVIVAAMENAKERQWYS